MNRTVSDVAKILDVNVSQLKRRAWLFNDHLTASANPPKGKVRTFSDADSLVLCYVGNEWEEEPDRSGMPSTKSRCNPDYAPVHCRGPGL
jgi:hypothetical protein